ncbi:hypothetical protein Psal027_03472 (plasmid) [Piscirickettsia salmonis]|nr:hypothetical protein AVI52_17085 [Piscirickettsia salmonis]QGN79160.1 hypothetical protein Psal001_03423 [Piscirickettsia salmonis]QGN82752.1 hypothetical protein Psal002_03450 [Piscirickettsia salmonis]QGN86265.1 hypothetical protein Psal003_03372 [Piscirickettsia salmonis]QGN89769.1 hypothetical protein Psal004_03362 [Piscirickettsia salmonis]
MPKLLEQKQWDKIYLFLKDFSGIYCGSERKCRLFIEAVIWFSVQAPNGVTYRKIMDIGIVFINGLVVGITEAFGMLFLHLCKHLN